VLLKVARPPLFAGAWPKGAGGSPREASEAIRAQDCCPPQSAGWPGRESL